MIFSSKPRRKRVVADPIWAIASIEPELNHGINVATLAVLFAMAFGKIDETILGEIGIAEPSPRHRDGETLLDLSRGPVSKLSPQRMREFNSHSAVSAQLVANFAPDLSPSILGHDRPPS